MTIPICRVPGTPGDSGRAHGAMIRDLLEPAAREAYLDLLAPINRYKATDLRRQSGRWLANLPPNYQEEIDGIATGSGVRTIEAAEWLYADIARPTHDGGPAADRELMADAPGPMCSAVMCGIEGAGPWVARNCDWLFATLVRGTACVVHETPHRIPVMAVGIRGDIDVDTGINAERLWLHLHTLLALDDPPRDRTIISWLFWAREALELCASLDDLERFIESTGRDRGVIAIAVDGKTGEGAVFECGKSGHRRHDYDPAAPLIATNHAIDKPIDAEREAKSRPGSTVARFCGLRRAVDEHPPEHGPDDFIDLLAGDAVEMRTPTHLRTIYSAVAHPATGGVWFASGDEKGRPAASAGRLEKVGFSFG